MWSASSSGSERPVGHIAVLAILASLLVIPAGRAIAAEAPARPRSAPAAPVPPASTALLVVPDASSSSTLSPLSWLPPHEPWIAAGLSLGVNGLGQVYNGDWDRAWWAWAPLLAYPVAWGIDSLAGSNVARTATVVWWTGAKAWSSWDAYHEAERRR